MKAIKNSKKLKAIKKIKSLLLLLSAFFCLPLTTHIYASVPRIADTIQLSQNESVNQPIAIAANPEDGSVFISGYYSGNILKVDPVTKKILAKASALKYSSVIKLAGGRVYMNGIDNIGYPKILVYDLNLNLIQTIVTKDYTYANSIDIDLEKQTLYYGSWGRLIAMNLNDFSQRQLVFFGSWIDVVSSVRLDKERNRAYLILSNYHSGTTEFVNFNLQTEQVAARIPIGTNPVKFDIRYDADRDGDNLFVTQMYSSSITVVNVADNAVTRDIPDISWPQRLVVDSEQHRLYVVDNYTDKFHVINTQNFDLIKTLTPGDDPSGVCIDKARNRIYTANVWTQDIGVVDALSYSLVERIALGPSTPLDVEIDGTGMAYVTNGPNGGVFRIDSATNKVLGKINFYDYTRVDNLYDFPVGLMNIFTGEIKTADSGNGDQYGFVLDEFNQSIAVLDLSAKKYVQHIIPDGIPSSLAVHDGKILFPYLSNSNLYLGVSDGAAIDPYLIGASEKSQGIKVNPVTQKCYIADYSNHQVAVFDYAQKKMLKRIDVGNYPAHIGIDTLTNRIYVSNYGSNSVSVIDGSNDEVIAQIDAGSAPWGIDVNSLTGRIYVVNSGDHSVSVINGKSNQVVSTLSVGQGARYCKVDSKNNKIFVPNQNSGSVTVIEDFVDAQSPVIECLSPIVIENVEEESVTVHFSTPIVKDNADSNPLIRINPVSGSLFYEGVTTVKVTATDQSGNESFCSFTVTVKTKNMPKPVGDLSATAFPGRKIELSWSVSPSPEVTAYKIYMGVSSVDFNAPVAVVPVQTTHWIAENLNDGETYQFVARTINGSGEEDKNMNIVSATAYDTPPCLSASIKSPQNGRKVSGQRLTVMAETRCGNGEEVETVRFEYKSASSGDSAWQLIPAANQEHSNPDQDFPYFVHWNVDNLSNGQYHVRAVATDYQENSDPSPSFITIKVDHSNPDSQESVNGNGNIERTEKLENQKNNKIIISGQNLSSPAQVQIPSGALNSQETKVTIKLNPASASKSKSALKSAGTQIEIDLQNGQHELSAEATLVLPYSDKNQDGIVDDTDINEKDLQLFYFNPQKSKWEKMGHSVVDSKTKTVTAKTSHFSLFGLFASEDFFADSAFHLGEVYCFPNPAKKGKNPTIHVESGISDRIDLRIYDLSGDLIHSVTLSEKPSVIDGRYAYEYPWDVSGVPSGIYVISVHAIKEDQGLRKLIKAAVIK